MLGKQFRVGVMALLAWGLLAPAASAQPTRIVRNGDAHQLELKGKPFLLLGGELSNSAASSAEFMEPLWPKFRALNMNTVVAPISWELIEPTEGRFDFSSLDMLLAGARKHELKLVLLWFGAWKNSMSSYAPAWVKRDPRRFPRVVLPDGSGTEILSAFSPNVLDSDARAFAAAMKHLRAVDADAGTVLMVQVENEIGMLPVAREHGAIADRLFAGPVPAELIRALSADPAKLEPELRAMWQAKGSRKSGSWAQLFGSDANGEEVFTAWHYARFADALTRAGKAQYPLPMYVNAALNRPGRKPGEYPSGGPVPHLLDVWKAGAPSIDMLSPDIYFPNFGALIARYDRPDNALFIPEANRIDRTDTGANALLSFGRHRAIGFSPFSIDDIAGDQAQSLGGLYGLLRDLAPLVLKAQADGTVRGVKASVAYDGTVDLKPQQFALGGYRFMATMVDPWTPKDKQQVGDHGALALQFGPEEYLVAGQGVTFTFEPIGAGPRTAGIDSAWEGRFEAGRWVRGRLLNGDETHQGRHVRLPPGEWSVQRIKLYRY